MYGFNLEMEVTVCTGYLKRKRRIVTFVEPEHDDRASLQQTFKRRKTAPLQLQSPEPSPPFAKSPSTQSGSDDETWNKYDDDDGVPLSFKTTTQLLEESVYRDPYTPEAQARRAQRERISEAYAAPEVFNEARRCEAKTERSETNTMTQTSLPTNRKPRANVHISRYSSWQKERLERYFRLLCANFDADGGLSFSHGHVETWRELERHQLEQTKVCNLLVESLDAV